MRPIMTPWCSGLESGAITAALCNEANTSDVGQYTRDNDFGTFAVAAGVATMSHTSGHTQFVSTGSSSASRKFLVVCDVTARSITGSPGFANSGVGLVNTAGAVLGNALLADYDHILGQVRLAWLTGGGAFTYGTGVACTLNPPYSVALACDGGKRAQMWTKSGGVWTFRVSADISATFGDAFVWTNWKAGFTVSCPNQSSWSFDNLKAAQRFR